MHDNNFPHSIYSSRLFHIIMDSSTFQRAKSAIESLWSCRSEFSSRVQDSKSTISGTITTSDKRSFFIALESLPSVRPLVTRQFVDSWENTDQSWAQYVDAVDNLGGYLTRNLELSSLTNMCHDELCGCPLSMGPVGNRGGVIRRTPCRRLDFQSINSYEIIDFKQVS
jgi:hypothetical protein